MVCATKNGMLSYHRRRLQLVLRDVGLLRQSEKTGSFLPKVLFIIELIFLVDLDWCADHVFYIGRYETYLKRCIISISNNLNRICEYPRERKVFIPACEH